MAAPRKDDERARLYAAALRLFGEKGYIATSYMDIVVACHTSKSVVQHYYPRKEMLLAHYIDDHFSWVIKKAQDLCPPQCDVLELLCMMGFIHLGMLIKDEEASPLVQDFLRHPALLDEMIIRERDWLADRCPDDLDRGFVGDCLVVGLSGAYGLLSVTLEEGRRVTPEYLMQITFVPFAISIGGKLERVEEIIEECSLLQETQ